MVASISSAKSKNYYLDLAHQDYYTKSLEESGYWWGTGAKTLGLSGEVTREDFSQLWSGRSTDGTEKLTQNADAQNRRSAWDITFSAPKSVSVIWAVADDETRRNLEISHQKAVADALSYLEKNAAYSRRGDGGKELEATGLTVATFQHGSSRAQDPELHTHSVILNVTTRRDLSTGSLDSFPLYTHTVSAGAVYRASLANDLQRQGYGVEKREKGLFEIAGVPTEIKQEWSKRSTAINTYIDENQLKDTPKNRQRAAEVTRTTKEHRPLEELRADWKETGNELNFNAQSISYLRSTPLRQGRFAVAKAKKEVLEESIEKLTRSNSVFTETQLDRALAENAIGRGLSYEQIKEVKQGFIFSREGVEVDYTRYDRSFTTLTIVKQELALKEVVQTLNNRKGHTVSAEVLEQTLAKSPTISGEQKEALHHVTTGKADLKVVSGMAGTGKTYFLNASREVWEKSGYEVVGLSLSGKAAAGLEEGAKIKSHTIDSFLGKLDAEKIASDSCANSPFERSSALLHSKSVIVVDEAGMVDTSRMTRLMEEAKIARAKVVLVGDSKQLQPIEAGGAFKSISDTVGCVELTDIRRQRDAWARDAVHDFASGNAEQALTAYADRGLVHTATNRDDLHRKMISDWSINGGCTHASDHLMIANTNKDVDSLNRLAQASRLEAGELRDNKIRVQDKTLYSADRILFGSNSAEYQIKNGQFATISRIDSIRQRLHVTLDSGDHRTINLKNYQDINLGYATTTHKAQGMTVENSYVLAGGGMQTRELSYVQMSRHRQEARIYAEARSTEEAVFTLSKQMNRSEQKTLATDRIAKEDERRRVRTLELT
jgi:Ti-type conjugative transfer relaxase TraA